jgi:hypothetical protein
MPANAGLARARQKTSSNHILVMKHPPCPAAGFTFHVAAKILGKP